MSKLAFLGGSPLRTKAWHPWPYFDEAEEKALLSALKEDVWGGYASSITDFQKDFAAAHQAKHCLLVNNGTVSIYAALKVLGIQPGDEVIVPAYTFVATASVVVMAGAVPVFVDVEPNTLNVSVKEIEKAISPKTKAIIPVHFGGQPVAMEAVKALADQHSLFIVEDCAHACFATRNNKSVSSIGQFSSFSFQQGKNLTCGEGGAILTNDDELMSKMWSFSNQGRGSKNTMWYGHESIGSNLRMTSFQAKILQSQFNKLCGQQTKRQEAIKFLNKAFASNPYVETIDFEEETTFHGAHAYVFKLKMDPDIPVSKSIILKAFRAEGLAGCSHGYRKALYQQKCFQDIPVVVKDCPVTEDFCKSSVSIKHQLLLADKEDLQDIVDIVTKVMDNVSDLVGATAG